MSSLFTAASVTTTNGTNLITVQSGEDIAAIRQNSWIQVGANPIMEVKRTFITEAGTKTIELFDNWEFGGGTGQRAIVAPTLGEIKQLADDVRQLIQSAEAIVETSNTSPVADSIAKRTSGGQVRTSEPESDEDAVRLQDLTPVKDKTDANEQTLSANSVAIARQQAMAKLERDAVFLGKFTEDRVIKSTGLSKVATSVADGITYTSPDGVTGVAANGTIQNAGVDQPPIVYDPETGECLGLQTCPATTNLVFPTEDMTVADTVKASNTIALGHVSLSEYVENTNNNNRNIGVLSNADAGVNSLSIFFKPLSAGQERYLILTDTTQAEGAYINCSTLEVGTSDADFVETALDPLINGVYRFKVSIKNVQSGDTLVARMRNSVSYSAGSYTGDGVSGLNLGGIQIEQGYPTPYQPAISSQISRAKSDSINDLEGMIKGKSGAFYAEFTAPEDTDNSAGARFFSISTNGFENRITFARRDDGQVGPYAISQTNSLSGLSSNMFGFVEAGSKCRLYFDYDEDANVNIAFNGQTYFGLGGDQPFSEDMLLLSIGSERGGNGGYCHFSEVIGSVNKLTDAEASAITTPEA